MKFTIEEKKKTLQNLNFEFDEVWWLKEDDIMYEYVLEEGNESFNIRTTYGNDDIESHENYEITYTENAFEKLAEYFYANSSNSNAVRFLTDLEVIEAGRNVIKKLSGENMIKFYRKVLLDSNPMYRIGPVGDTFMIKLEQNEEKSD